ncbi:MAG: NPCBM/NEW2 domain-containing protein, partial [Planctomycetota bacterium]|nr:NPCBM/NEW2 domain-containing protein [Planctomycetota bacterium]
MKRSSIRNPAWLTIGIALVGLGCAAVVLGAKSSEPQVYARAATWADTMTATRANYIKWAAENNRPADPAAFQPFDSGPMAGDGPGRQVSISVAGVKTLRLLTTCEKGTANCNIWGDPKLIAADGKETPLGDLKPDSITVGWGKMLLDKNWQEKPLRVGDREFKRGIWVHASSELVYTLDGKVQRLEAWVGEDKDRANGTVRFPVLSGDAPQLPAWWTRLAEDFPREAAWLADDAGAGALAWFAARTDASFEQSLVDRCASQLGGAAESLKIQAQALQQAAAPAGDPRWLELYSLACRARRCATVIGQVSIWTRPAYEAELRGLVSAKAASDDPRWT